MVGCGRKVSHVADGMQIVVIDSCEYFKQAVYGVGYYVYSHKGNCRFCAERNKRMVREQVDSILTQIFD